MVLSIEGFGQWVGPVRVCHSSDVANEAEGRLSSRAAGKGAHVG